MRRARPLPSLCEHVRDDHTRLLRAIHCILIKVCASDAGIKRDVALEIESICDVLGVF